MGSQQNQRKTNLAKLKKTNDKESKAPNLFRKDGARNLGSQQNQRKTNLAKLRKTKHTGTDEKAPNPLRKDGCKEPGISTKLAQNQSSKIEKKTTDIEEKTANRFR